MTKQATCADRIQDQLAGRLQDFRELVGRMNSDDDTTRDEAFTEQAEYPLSVELVRSVRIVLSTGGPHDEFVCELDSDGDIARIRYAFKDWGDHADKWLEGGEFDAAEAFLRDFVDGALGQ